MNWFTPVRFVPMVGPIMAKKLAKLEIATVGDLLLHLPFRYTDYSLISSITNLQESEIVTVKGVVTNATNVYRSKGLTLQKIMVKDSTGSIQATWFNQPFLIKTLVVGTQVNLSGKVSRFGHALNLESPEYELVKEEKPLLHTGRLVPVYPETAGASSKWFRNRINFLFNQNFIVEFLPSDVLDKYHLLRIEVALSKIHFPALLSEVGEAHRRLSFDELFVLSLQSTLRRQEWQNRGVRTPLKIDKVKLETFQTSLPFILTQAQKRVTAEILSDFEKSTPMNRLLEGEVGSGKTVVAAIAMYVACLNGYRSLVMAPTEILSEQHYKTLSELLSPFGLKIGIQTGSVKNLKLKISAKGGSSFGRKSQKKLDIKNVNSAPDILVGTHALIEKSSRLDNVGLVVIDEQHRFGVRQRALLREKGATPHVLTMTATPIPRTMALTIYGDLDLSVIDELPHGRKYVRTWVVPAQKRLNAYAWIKKQLTDVPKSQVFIICPFIEPSESLMTVKAATDEYQRLKKEIFSQFSLGLLHGKLKNHDKNQIMSDFKAGKYRLLVSTPVVEVGIDVPTATIMLIEAAERFGLAQLHQLRGRVGRSGIQSYCLLFTSNGATGIDRLKHMEKTYSGAKLADLDLKIRGPGQVFGTLQHGKDLLKIANYSDPNLITSAKVAAEEVYHQDPDFIHNQALKERVLSGTISDISAD